MKDSTQFSSKIKKSTGKKEVEEVQISER